MLAMLHEGLIEIAFDSHEDLPQLAKPWPGGMPTGTPTLLTSASCG